MNWPRPASPANGRCRCRSDTNVSLECGSRMDILAEDQVVVELRTVEKLLPVHDAQMLTYLRLSGCRVGLLVNFNVPVLRDGIKRLVL